MYYKDNILIPANSNQKVTVLNSSRGRNEEDKPVMPSATNLQVNSTQEKSLAESFMSYLDCWTESARNLDISESLKVAVEQIKSFPADSVAFFVGVKEVVKIASAETCAMVENVNEELESNGFTKTLKSYALSALKQVGEVVAYGYNEISKVASKISKEILGDDIHESLASFLDRYLSGLGNFLMDNIKYLLGDEESELDKVEDQLLNQQLRIDSEKSYTFNESSAEKTKEDVVSDLIEKASDFLSHSKYFAHNILDNNDEDSRLKPEMLIEGELRTLPIYQPLPPEWVVQKMEKLELAERARKGTIA